MEVLVGCHHIGLINIIIINLILKPEIIDFLDPRKHGFPLMPSPISPATVSLRLPLHPSIDPNMAITLMQLQLLTHRNS